MKSLNDDISLINFLRNEELAALKLRALYSCNGYIGWRMSKFEEYEFYIRNKDFLVSENVLTFTDVNGKLMALKPDITLSIIRHMKDEPESLRKVFYDENVYRVSGNSKTFKEIKQAGVECVGAVTEREVSEIILLAADSLKLLAADRNISLNISHLDLIAELLAKLNLNLETQNKIIKFIADKNSHGIKELCNSDELVKLAGLSGSYKAVMPELENIFNKNNLSLNNFKNIIKNLINKNSELENILRIDFSAVSDLNYYNGLVFQGFIESIPARILTGGQYDKLMRRMGHKSGAVGFAVYLDMLERGVRQ